MTHQLIVAQRPSCLKSSSRRRQSANDAQRTKGHSVWHQRERTSVRAIATLRALLFSAGYPLRLRRTWAQQPEP